MIQLKDSTAHSRRCYKDCAMNTEQPKQWHRFINQLLFPDRKAPQEATGFVPFELLYGRTVRGPIQILKELWTEEADLP